MTAPTITGKPVSDRQRALISRLLDEKVIEDTVAEALHTMIADMQTTKQASAIIDMLFALPRKDATEGTSRVEPTDGLYRVGDDIVRIKVSKSGNWYAQRAMKPGPNSGRKSLIWDYLGKRIDMHGAEALADEEAGKFLGYCVRCNAELTDPDSIARGIGPVCAKK